jgi:hypothetical protein
VDLIAELDAYTPRTPAEAADVARVRALVATDDPLLRSTRLHVTGSALVVHPPTGRVLLRWHERMGGWRWRARPRTLGRRPQVKVEVEVEGCL